MPTVVHRPPAPTWRSWGRWWLFLAVVVVLVVAEVSDKEHAPGDVSLTVLSPRQREVAALIAAGCTNKEIAGELGLTPSTVSVYMQQIRWQLRVKHRIQ